MARFNEFKATARSVSSERLLALEPWIYLTYVGICTLVAARGFFHARTTHLAWAEASRIALDPSVPARHLAPVWWSAPLDDTFIHFDFARSFANGHPFEWTPDGGYSSGATSWLYPMLLAVGVLLGCHGQSLGIVADMIACMSMFGFFWAARSLFRDLPRWTSYLLPPFVLTSGVLGWSLWSGMELALFFGIWGLLAHYFSEHRNATHLDRALQARRGMALAGLLLVMTRPEALLCVGLCAWFSASGANESSDRRWRVVGHILWPALAFTAMRSLVNRAMTGSFADAGAIVKLHTMRPFLEPREMALKWLGNVGFQFSRITSYHTTDSTEWGWQLWVLVALAFFPKRTRFTVAWLVLQALAWLLLVAQNEYVRYQNDRYTMPVVFWLLVASALGMAANLAQANLAIRTIRPPAKLVVPALSALVAGSFIAHQFPRLNQQRWLFGRASRNIAEQQIRVGQLLEAGRFGETHRVLVGDAGAIPYFSGLRGVDAIGLGGTQHLPFAKALNLGVGATVELVERMRPEERPDRLALYPSWWDLLPVWFGQQIDEVSIRGNVICGATNKVIYLADWHALEDHHQPARLKGGVPVVDELDFADVVSESEHDFEVSSKHSGYVVMKILPELGEPHRELFDAGRLIFWGTRTSFYLRGLRVGHPARLVFRTAPNYPSTFRVKVDGRDMGKIEVEPTDGWQQPSLDLDPKHLRDTVLVEIQSESSETILYHLWATSQ